MSSLADLDHLFHRLKERVIAGLSDEEIDIAIEQIVDLNDRCRIEATRLMEHVNQLQMRRTRLTELRQFLDDAKTERQRGEKAEEDRTISGNGHV